MKRIYVTIELFKNTESPYPEIGAKKPVTLEDTVTTVDQLVAEIKNQTKIGTTVGEKVFIDGKEAEGTIELDKINSIKFIGYKKDLDKRYANKIANAAKMSAEPVKTSRFDGSKAKEFMASKKK